MYIQTKMNTKYSILFQIKDIFSEKYGIIILGIGNFSLSLLFLSFHSFYNNQIIVQRRFFFLLIICALFYDFETFRLYIIILQNKKERIEISV